MPEWGIYIGGSYDLENFIIGVVFIAVLLRRPYHTVVPDGTLGLVLIPSAILDHLRRKAKSFPLSKLERGLGGEVIG